MQGKISERIFQVGEYIVDVKLAFCSCNIGMRGANCAHQKIVARKYKIFNIHSQPFLTEEGRIFLSKIIGLGSELNTAPLWQNPKTPTVAANNIESLISISAENNNEALNIKETENGILTTIVEDDHDLIPDFDECTNEDEEYFLTSQF